MNSPVYCLALEQPQKEDLGYSCAELVYGEPLTVPGEFISNNNSPWLPSDFLNSFRTSTQLHAPRPTMHHSTTPTCMPPSLSLAKYVYVRQDAKKHSLQRPYTGPYIVLAAGGKTFLLDIGGRVERVAIDRLKPAHTDSSQPVTVAKPRSRGRPPMPQEEHDNNNTGASSNNSLSPGVRVSRAGRGVQPPCRYRDQQGVLRVVSLWGELCGDQIIWIHIGPLHRIAVKG